MDYKVVLLILLIGALLLAVYTSVEPFADMGPQYQKYPNADRGGADIGCYNSPVDFCKQKCDLDPNCKSYNFVYPNSVWGAASGCCYKSTATPILPQDGIDFYVKLPPPELPPPPAASTVNVVTVAEKKTPVMDGASGLHYSGRVYTNQMQQLSSDICGGQTASASQINDVMPNGISTTTLPIDEGTKRISQPALESYAKSLVARGSIPGQKPEFNDQMNVDKTFYASLRNEYCFYETRYVAALNQFLTLVANPNGADTTAALAITITLNKRLNSLLEIMNYVSNSRARLVNDRSKKLNEYNDDLQSKIRILRSQQDFLQSGDVVLQTQEEMMRYSAEKSQATNIQIAFFVALNIVAIGTVLTVYKSVRPSV
jgi:hypothetical protein